MAKPERATAEYDRWHALWTWCQSLGCCMNCATGSACAIVQREASNRTWGAPPTELCTNEKKCLDLVRNNWKDSPKKDVPK